MIIFAIPFSVDLIYVVEMVNWIIAQSLDGIHFRLFGVQLVLGVFDVARTIGTRYLRGFVSP